MTASAIARPALRFDALSQRSFWDRLAPRCQQPGCNQSRHFWRRLRHRRQQVVLAGLRCCLDCCLDGALRDRLAQASRVPVRTVVRHRIPIGLLLISRQQLTSAQLRAALNAQSVAGRGRIGEWLQELGYASEEQVTAALARQWSCPMLRGETLGLSNRRAPQIPLVLMRWLAMAPVEFVDSTRTLHVAFAEGLDYSVLYALEQMLECRTEPCLVRPSILGHYFGQMTEAHREGEVLFERMNDIAEFSRIVRSYVMRLAASEIRLTRCGSHVWVRLTRTPGRHMDLVVREVRDASDPTQLLSFVPAKST
jgi:hypothetical protein